MREATVPDEERLWIRGWLCVEQAMRRSRVWSSPSDCGGSSREIAAASRRACHCALWQSRTRRRVSGTAGREYGGVLVPSSRESTRLRSGGDRGFRPGVCRCCGVAAWPVVRSCFSTTQQHGCGVGAGALPWASASARCYAVTHAPRTLSCGQTPDLTSNSFHFPSESWC